MVRDAQDGRVNALNGPCFGLWFQWLKVSTPAATPILSLGILEGAKIQQPCDVAVCSPHQSLPSRLRRPKPKAATLE